IVSPPSKNLFKSSTLNIHGIIHWHQILSNARLTAVDEEAADFLHLV
ncbi:5733_t:CDS:1, partial [Diversispora eburnea]